MRTSHARRPLHTQCEFEQEEKQNKSRDRAADCTRLLRFSAVPDDRLCRRRHSRRHFRRRAKKFLSSRSRNSKRQVASRCANRAEQTSHGQTIVPQSKPYKLTSSMHDLKITKSIGEA